MVEEPCVLRLLYFHSFHEIEVLNAGTQVHSIVMEVKRWFIAIFISTALSIVKRTSCRHLTLLCHVMKRLIFFCIGLQCLDYMLIQVLSHDYCQLMNDTEYVLRCLLVSVNRRPIMSSICLLVALLILLAWSRDLIYQRVHMSVHQVFILYEPRMIPVLFHLQVLQLWDQLPKVLPLLSDPIDFLDYHRVLIDQAFDYHGVRDEPQEFTVGYSINY